MSVFLQNLSESEVRCSFKLSVLDINKAITNTFSSCSIVTFGEKFSSAPSYEDGYEKFLILENCFLPNLQDQSEQLLPNGCLTIVCDLTIFGNSSNTATLFNHLEEVQEGGKHLSQDLEKLFSDKEMSDVQIICGDKVFECHQLILSARSPVFRVMFQAEMTEKAQHVG